MTKAKLCSLALAGVIGLASVTPMTVSATETKTGTTTQTEKNYNHNSKRAEFEKKMKAAKDKWNTLSQEQKNEVYALLENGMNEESKILDKLVELGIFAQADADILIAFKLERLKQLKESGEFPFFNGKGRKQQILVRMESVGF